MWGIPHDSLATKSACRTVADLQGNPPRGIAYSGGQAVLREIPCSVGYHAAWETVPVHLTAFIAG